MHVITFSTLHLPHLLSMSRSYGRGWRCCQSLSWVVAGFFEPRVLDLLPTQDGRGGSIYCNPCHMSSSLIFQGVKVYMFSLPFFKICASQLGCISHIGVNSSTHMWTKRLVFSEFWTPPNSVTPSIHTGGWRLEGWRLYRQIYVKTEVPNSKSSDFFVSKKMHLSNPPHFSNFRREVFKASGIECQNLRVVVVVN